MVSADFLNDEDSRWHIQPCAKRSFFGRKDHPESDYRTLLLAVDKTLRDCSHISDIRWFPFFDTPDYLALLPYSSGPVRAADFQEQLHPLIRLDWQISRISSAIASPLGLALGFVFLLLIAAIAPAFVRYIAFAVFVFMLVLMVVVPMVLGSLIRRQARRISA
jgi:hypothetical protein